MKNLIILFIVSFTLLSNYHLNAQDEQKTRKPRINEVGVTTQGFSQFGLDYKLEKKNNWYWRFSTIAAGGESEVTTVDSTKTTRNAHQVAVGVGIEKRIHLNPDFQFKYGFGISTFFNSSVRLVKWPLFTILPNLKGFIFLTV